MNLYILY